MKRRGESKAQAISMVGYARVSTSEQSLSQQISALKAAGCGVVFEDVCSGARAARPGLDKALAYLRPGDVLVVVKIDRLGRSISHLVQVVETLRERGVGFRSLSNSGMDTTTPEGRLIFAIFAGLADFERSLIAERTRVALAARKLQGIKGGRRPAVTSAILKRAHALMDTDGKALSVREAAAVLKVSKSALYRALKAKID